MAIPTIFLEVRKDVESSLKKYTKQDWLNHARSLQNLDKKTKKVETLTNLVESLIPKTKKFQDLIIKREYKGSLWSVLNKELILLNHIDNLFESLKNKKITENQLWAISTDLAKELTITAKLEETMLKNL